MRPDDGFSEESVKTLAAADIGAWHWDARTDLITGNGVFLRMLGLEHETQSSGIKSQRMRDVIYEADLAMIPPADKWASSRNNKLVWEFRVKSNDATHYWMLLRGFVTRDDSQRVTGAKGILIDISECHKDDPDTETGFAIYDRMPYASPLDEAVDLVAAARKKILESEGETSDVLRPLFDGLLFAVGRELAKSIGNVPLDAIIDPKKH